VSPGKLSTLGRFHQLEDHSRSRLTRAWPFRQIRQGSTDAKADAKVEKERLMHAAIYARFSTPRQEREQNIESQINDLKNWANENGHKHFAREHLHRRIQHPS
jgi:hypothetical protein